MYNLIRLALLTLACGVVPAVVVAQGLPTSQPALVTIVREDCTVPADLDRWSRAGADVLNSTRTLQAAARPAKKPS
jgi:hypothetical protein